MKTKNKTFLILKATFLFFVLSGFIAVNSISAEAENSDLNQNSKYLEAMREFADNVLKYGRDTYGPKHTPLFFDGLVKNNFGFSPLHRVCQRGKKECVELLIDKGADINAQNNFGWTPLHIAARNGQKDIVELLIANGADVNIKNKGGLIPLDLAMNQGHKEIIELLRKHGAKE